MRAMRRAPGEGRKTRRTSAPAGASSPSGGRGGSGGRVGSACSLRPDGPTPAPWGASAGVAGRGSGVSRPSSPCRSRANCSRGDWPGNSSASSRSASSGCALLSSSSLRKSLSAGSSRSGIHCLHPACHPLVSGLISPICTSEMTSGTVAGPHRRLSLIQ